MQNITLGQIAACIGFLVTLISGFEFLNVRMSKRFGKEIRNIINEEIKDLKEQVMEIRKDVDINERDRIRYEILQFSGSLRNGLERTDNDYKHIEELFEKYQEKGWNSYIHSEMRFIRNYRNKIDK